MTLLLDGNSLTLKDITAITQRIPIAIAPECKKKLHASRIIVEKMAEGDQPVYGVNTGFGWLANKRVPKSKLKELQRNVLISHASGMGDLLSLEETRLAMVLRLNVLLKGYTGVRFLLCEKLCDLINAGIYPRIPEYGSLGASGDLIPLAHLALPLIGEGEVYYEGKYLAAKAALKKAGLTPIILEAKEGLSLVNGTQIMLSVGGLAIVHALQLAEQVDKIAALSYEGVCAHLEPLNPLIHSLRIQPGQILSAKTLLNELKGSYLHDKKTVRKRVQDPYSLRCAPQVHGASRDVLNFAAEVVSRELNAATDNPLVDIEAKQIISGGNFHGQPLALAYDAASMAVAEFGNISERRIEALINPHISGLPAFLTPEEGVNSGYMSLQYLAGSYVNENKILSHPASTDSIPGNVGIEDFVSMGMTSARKLRKIISNTKNILSAEMLVAAQAVDLRKNVKLGKGTQYTYNALRAKVKTLKEDRILENDLMEALNTLDEIV